jgi:hypothetical protein
MLKRVSTEELNSGLDERTHPAKAPGQVALG